MEGAVTLKFCWGGVFKRDSSGALLYVGRQSCTFAVDSDELSWWELLELAKKCRGDDKIASIQYLIPGQKLEDGLRNVYSDKEVREMVDIALKFRTIDLFVVEVGQIDGNTNSISPTRRKLTPKRKGPTRSTPRKCCTIDKEAGVSGTTSTVEPTPTSQLTIKSSQKRTTTFKDASKSSKRGPPLSPTSQNNVYSLDGGDNLVNPNAHILLSQDTEQPQSCSQAVEQLVHASQLSQALPKQTNSIVVPQDYEWNCIGDNASD